jgi:large subunit ribosomal protein L46
MMNHLLLRRASSALSFPALPLKIFRPFLALPHNGGVPVTATTTRTLATGYLAQKEAAKVKRRQRYEAYQERQAGLKTRRAGKQPRQECQDFRKWFVTKKVDDEYKDRKARQAGLDWKIRVAIILERTPVVLPDKEDWEIEFENLSGYMMQFGQQYPKELFPVDYESEKAVSDEDLLKLLPKGYVPAPRETEADMSGNVRTTDRKLKTSVFLTVQDDKDVWQLPSVALGEDESLLNAAKRAITEMVGNETIDIWCPSNCPCGVDVVAFPNEQRTDGFYGTKTFFMKVRYDEGEVKDQVLKAKDYAWLDRNEVVHRVSEQQGDSKSKLYRYLL